MGKKVGIEIEVDSSGAVTSFKQLGEAGAKSTDKIALGSKEATQSISKLNAKTVLATGSMVALGAAAIKFSSNFVRAGIETTKQAEKVQTQFKTILGSAQEAQERYAELAQFAASTPFELKGVANASKILETLTEGALSTGEGLRSVGDAAAIAGVGFDELAVHIGRAYSGLQANRPIGEAMARLQELGLVSGKVRNRIEELQKQAKGKEAWTVLQEELKKTSGGMEELSQTLEGKTSTLVDNIGLVSAALLEVSGATDAWKSSLTGLVNVAGSALNNLELMKVEQKNINDLTLSEAKLLKSSLDVKLKHNEASRERNKINDESVGGKAEILNTENEALKKQLETLEKIIVFEARNAELRKQDVAKEKEAEPTESISEKKRKELEELAISDQKWRDDNINAIADANTEIAAIEGEAIQKRHQEQLRKKREFNDILLREHRDRIKKQAKLDELAAKTEMRQNLAIADQSIALGKEVFGENKLFTIADIGLSTARGMMSALASTPPNVPLSVLIGATGAVQAAKASGIKLADGGMIDGPGTNRSDSIPVRGSRGEAVINEPAVQRLGGEDGINAINSGGGVGTSINITVNAGFGSDGNGIAQAVANAIRDIEEYSIEPSVV